MRVFKSNTKNIGYLVYRLATPFFDPIKFVRGISAYFWFFRDWRRYKSKAPSAQIAGMNLCPVLGDKTTLTPFDAHYFFQDSWAFGNILAKRPGVHVDIGSSYQISAYLSKIVKTVFVDFRPIDTKMKNLEIKQGDILDLPFENNSIESLSCLSVAEHIGLGRYGDGINPDGTRKACKELSRVLAEGGNLYFSLPIGKERLCFNAHRIHSPVTILNYFKDLALVQFSVVDDNDVFSENVDPKKFEDINYGCGLFMFTKIKEK